MAITGRIVKVRNPRRCEVPEDSGVISLPVSIVAFADDCTGKRIENSRSCGARSLVEITRGLLQKRRQYRISDEISGNRVCVVGSVALCIALESLSIPFDVVL